MFLITLLFITVYSQSVEVEEIKWSTGAAGEVVASMAHNEESDYKYTYVLHYPTSSQNSIKIDCIHPTYESVSIQVSTSTPVRPVIAATTKKLYFLNNGNFEVYNIEQKIPVAVAFPAKSSTDANSPMDVIDREFYTGKREVYVVVCQNKHLTVLNESLDKVKEYPNPCGEYINWGYDYVAVKNSSMIDIYGVSTGGVLTFYKTITLADNTTKTYAFDGMVMSGHDVIYTALSDVGKIQVNSPNNYGYATFIKDVWFNGNHSTNYVKTQYAQMMYTYGSFLAVGVFGYTEASRERVGGVDLYFDKYLTGNTNRFEKVYSFRGNSSYGYRGYSVGMDDKMLYIGGKLETQTIEVLKAAIVDVSNYTAKYCVGMNCECESGYFYSTYYKKCFAQLRPNTAIIVTACCFVLFFIIIAIVGVLLAYMMKSKEKERNKKDDDFEEKNEVIVESEEEKKGEKDEFIP
ncbi:hypothetical protein EIN_172640 [Entamoeba invadens IP1]|uniref:Uncharacterized protein n=2 Tax=Entamoeba invadens TaxID=33085 RepID=A0A0A1TVT8_ENTIV|nr:hypothetical protein EIN_172640 [Entamoeba invadens IP1]ELP84619.1 hypothetical protein EIN_172640 [Entamoeba invadens IP1]BAN41348.1 hypothetical protein [Entamoeba invadens]|eukprot:XP_004183965.1 hypothetical protein EIN_172640 [Entamoeba invadens IP1]